MSIDSEEHDNLNPVDPNEFDDWSEVDSTVVELPADSVVELPGGDN